MEVFMISFKKLLFISTVFVIFGIVRLSQAMSDQQKYTIASFAHDHSITTSLVPNFIAFRCLSPYKGRPMTRFGVFSTATALGTVIAQFSGHEYLQKNGYHHHPKMYVPLCSNNCSTLNSTSFNQKVALFLNKTYSNIRNLWNQK